MSVVLVSGWGAGGFDSRLGCLGVGEARMIRKGSIFPVYLVFRLALDTCSPLFSQSLTFGVTGWRGILFNIPT